MGQNQTGYTNPILEDWLPHPRDQNVFINSKTGEQVQQHAVQLKKTQQIILKKRMQEHHNFIAKVLYYEPAEKNKIVKEETKYFVYTERLYPLCNELWTPVTSALSILKGYRRLSSTYGAMRVYEGMVKVNFKKEIQVWINENPAKSNEVYRAESEEQMLADIVKIIMQFDSQTGGLMVKCFTLNQAINNILHNMTQSKSVLHFSSRTNKKQDKPRITQKDTTFGTAKNNFRSTKQTQDDSLKPFNDSTMKQVSKNDSIMQSKPKQIRVNYLQGVNIHKSPTYINTSTKRESPKKVHSPMGFRKDSDDSNSHYLNYSHQNNVQKQSSIQFNNTQPISNNQVKLTGSVRTYKPIEHRAPNYSQSMYSYNTLSSQMTPSHERSIGQSNKFKEVLHKPYQPPAGRQSNLNKQFLDRIENSEEGSLHQDQRTAKDSLYVNERSQINTSREFNPGSHQNIVVNNRSPTNSDHYNLMYFDANRTKTQEFYSTNQLHGVSPRLKTNFITTNIQSPKQIIAQSGFNHNKKVYGEVPSNTQYSYKKPQQNSQYHIVDINKQKFSIRTQPPQEEKKQIKLKQAQQIKQEMGNLGILNNTAKPLTNDKSVRDLLIKQRVEQKNKKHQELKNAITKLLNQ